MIKRHIILHFFVTKKAVRKGTKKSHLNEASQTLITPKKTVFLTCLLNHRFVYKLNMMPISLCTVSLLFFKEHLFLSSIGMLIN